MKQRQRRIAELRPTSLRRLRPLLPGLRGRLLLIALTAFAAGLMEAGVLLVVVRAALAIAANDRQIDISVWQVSWSLTIPGLLFLALGLTLVRLALDLVGAWLTGTTASDMLVKARVRMFAAYTKATWDEQSRLEDGHVLDLLTRHVTQTSTAVLVGASGTESLCSFTALLISAFVVDLRSATAIIVVAVTLFALMRPLTRLARNFTEAKVNAGRSYAKVITEVVPMAQEIRTFHVGDEVNRRAEALSRTESDAGAKGIFLAQALRAVYQTTTLLVLIGGLYLVYRFVRTDLSSVGAIVLILLRAMSYSQGVQTTYHRIVELVPFSDRLIAEQTRLESQAAPDAGEELKSLRRISLSGVSFRYRPERIALDDVSLTIEHGETVGIIGPSGSGKSTLVQVLLRLRIPTTGQFLVNDDDAGAYSATSWYHRVAFLPQDPKLMSMSVRDNIVFFRPGVTDKQVVDAAKRAQIHDDIISWPDGYDTHVGPRGTAISGGQRQRLALARALLLDPDVLILDEPTSALDLASEAAVQETLTRLRGRTTLIVVAHRMTTLNVCDLILVLRDGKVQAFGTRTELEAESEFYREAVALSGIH